MTKKTCRNHSPAFKSKAALAALQDETTIAQLADQFGIHVSQVSDWKEQLLAGAADLFEAARRRPTVGAGDRCQITPRQDRGADRGERVFRKCAQQGRIAERKAMIDRSDT